MRPLSEALYSLQWDASENAGFSKGKPWMRVHDDYKEWNVEAQRKDPNSVWAFWKRMLQLRKEYEALVYGTSSRCMGAVSS